MIVSLVPNHNQEEKAYRLDKFKLALYIMQIQHKQTDNKGVFFIQSDGEDILAELTYMKQGEDTMILEHTEVSEELKGQNIGYQLVSAAVEHARSHRMKVIPMCPFAGAIISKKPEFKDLLSD